MPLAAATKTRVANEERLIQVLFTGLQRYSATVELRNQRKLFWGNHYRELYQSKQERSFSPNDHSVGSYGQLVLTVSWS